MGKEISGRAGGYSAVSCARMAELIDTLFRLWALVGLKVICNDFLVVKVNCWSHALI